MTDSIGDIVLDPTTRKYYPVKAYLDRIPKDKLKVSAALVFFILLVCLILYLPTKMYKMHRDECIRVKFGCMRPSKSRVFNLCHQLVESKALDLYPN